MSTTLRFLATLTLRSTYTVVLICCAVLLIVSRPAAAQEGQRLSVTPALFEMSAAPLQEWRSGIKVINPNRYPLTVYVEPLNFVPRGEGGDGSLVPVLTSEADGVTLAEWIEINRGAIQIPAEQSIEVPFVVRVPENAAPGGHFSAFTVSTRPPDATPGATQIRTAQVVTSLFFVRIAGAVVEQGSIREFRAERRFVGKPEVTFGLRFENQGNVHLRPQGDIVITNMWGQERGVIPINRQAHFGNVLPDSIRKFTFTWQGDLSLADIGRYEASVTLAYGQDARQFVTSTTNFWVIPLWPLAITLGTLATVIALAIWLIRWYVRRMLALSGYTPVARQPVVRMRRRSDLDLAQAPVAATVLPPERRLAWVLALLTKIWTYGRQRLSRLQWVFAYVRSRSDRQQVLVVLSALVLLLVLLGFFMRSALVTERPYQVRYDDAVASDTVGSDQIQFESARSESPVSHTRTDGLGGTLPRVDIVNVSGVAGAGATVALLIEAKGYEVGEISTELGAEQGRTVIVYDPAVTEVALALSADLDNAPLSAFTEPASTTAAVIIYVGSDLVQATEE